eukprot:3416788-Amphidinium_carterae.1
MLFGKSGPRFKSASVWSESKQCQGGNEIVTWEPSKRSEAIHWTSSNHKPTPLKTTLEQTS